MTKDIREVEVMEQNTVKEQRESNSVPITGDMRGLKIPPSVSLLEENGGHQTANKSSTANSHSNAEHIQSQAANESARKRKRPTRHEVQSPDVQNTLPLEERDRRTRKKVQVERDSRRTLSRSTLIDTVISHSKRNDLSFEGIHIQTLSHFCS